MCQSYASKNLFTNRNSDTLLAEVDLVCICMCASRMVSVHTCIYTSSVCIGMSKID